MSHVSRLRTFTKGDPYFSDQELELFEQIISAPREEEIAEEFVEAPAHDAPPAQTGVPVNDVLRLMQGFTDALKNLQINVQAPTVNVSPEVKLPAVKRITRVNRDRAGKMESTETEERPIP